MPVVLRKVSSASLNEYPQWQHDLYKIYADAPEQRRQLDASQVPLDAPTFVDQSLQAGAYFAAALFNDHLIAALRVQEQEDVWQISHLCVRRVTRRRGVASRLLALVAAEAAQVNKSLTSPLYALEMPDHILLQKMGYQLDAASESYLWHVRH
ncbi:Acetyltransferase (GNAT) domain-containing protein [Allopseudospirillum japonicum]|uniref:Acetyltransferase (GNAT) domain-containing protein n=1 Tax=Allopseudospirillum japonicum TaxID=64971 RepID=A0A1H6R532_9GAMM|nr:acetyl-CoA sensor PanZ family protein [Allopseudospirillum japonicum]SEI50853.1 Acetyltransferase (GNAT) domain-containing protein [Allopseudospirillum japonicum]